MKIGYIYGDRVPDRLTKETKKAYAGTRSVLKQIIERTQKGDTLIINSVTDIADNYNELLNRLSAWKNKLGLRIRSIEEGYDSNDKVFYLANAHEVDRIWQEREQARNERIIKRARKTHPKKIWKMRKAGITVKRIAEIEDIHPNTVVNNTRDAIRMKLK